MGRCARRSNSGGRSRTDRRHPREQGLRQRTARVRERRRTESCVAHTAARLASALGSTPQRDKIALVGVPQAAGWRTMAMRGLAELSPPEAEHTVLELPTNRAEYV